MDRPRFKSFPQAGPCPPAPGAQSWQSLMDLALEEALKAEKSGEIPVGAALVDPRGEIMALAHNEVEFRHDPSAHAEILALRKGASIIGNHRLEGCYLVCTLEPCLMCAGAICHARLAGLVYGAVDQAAGAISSCADFWNLPGANQNIWHMGGMLSTRCALVLRNFFQSRR